jgi:four helix bundle protein
LVQDIYKDLCFGPGSKDFGWDQLQRAGISVMNNIADGFERFTDTEFGSLSRHG